MIKNDNIGIDKSLNMKIFAIFIYDYFFCVLSGEKSFST